VQISVIVSKQLVQFVKFVSMENKKLIQILLPLYDEEGKLFPATAYARIKEELTEKFGGLTVYTRSPATGLWKESDEKVSRDDIIIYEVVAEDIDKSWWRIYKTSLEQHFRQQEVMIRSMDITMI
jgi:hypothetical protein